MNSVKKTFFRRILALLLALLLTLPPMVHGAVSIATDADFFAKLNLNRSGLEKVKAAVAKKDYSSAKKELLSYYQQTFASYDAKPFSGTSEKRVFMAMNDVWCFSEDYIDGVEVTSTSYAPYTLDLSSNLNGIYILDQIYATVDGVAIATSESSTPPELALYGANGVLLKTLTATEDTCVRPGKDLSANYGSATTIYAKHWPDTAKGLPYSSATMRCYLRFDASQIPSNARTAKLTVYCKRSPGNADKVLVEDSLYLCAFQSYCTNWSEDSLTWDSLVSGRAISHYSYNGLSGGFDWKKPAGTPSEWLNYNTRFYEVRSLVLMANQTEDEALRKSYMAKAKELVLDFVKDAGENTPANRALEPANRLIEFPYIYKYLVNELTPDENILILSWVYDDTTAQYNGAYNVFDGATANPKSNLPYTNWGLWHLTGFYSALCYFPEFADSSAWRSVYDARLGVVMGGIIKEDGSYNEVTFGYPGSVISWCATLKDIMNQFGDTSDNAAMFSQKMMQLTKYLIDCTLPNGKMPFWGEGGPSTGIAATNTTLASLNTKELQTELAGYLRNYQNRSNGIPLKNTAQYDGIKVVTDRTGWTGADSMIFMNAKCAGSHSHRDALALLLYYQGRSLLTDTGMTSYDGAHLHFPFQRSTTRSHNTIEVDGLAQTLGTMVSQGDDKGAIEITGNPAVSTITSWSTASNKDMATLKVEGTKTTTAYHSTTFNHSRDVSFLKELGSILVVTDKVEPQDTAVHSYTQNWHCAPFANNSISADAYLTGTTAYSTGPNLIIAQADTNGIRASLQTGYDATSPAAPTKYFEYKQSKAGTVTYQTILYPVASGAAATVQPKKIAMANTSDAQALAMEVSISDSSKPQLSGLVHYHSFEDSPSERGFGSYGTNASTAMAAVNVQGQIFFASLSQGSSLTKNGSPILQASEAIEDISAVLENGVLSLYTQDTKAQGMRFVLNFSGQTVTKVLLNDVPIAFSQAEDGTVVVKARYVLLDFTQDSMAAQSSHWDGLRATAEVSRGVLSGTISGGDPNIRMNTSAESLGYEITDGDIIELRMKTTLTEGSAAGVQVFFLDRNTASYSESYSCKNLTLEHATGRYATIQLPFLSNGKYMGSTIDRLRVDMLHLVSEAGVTASYEIDYIYMGPAELAPSATAKPAEYLYFDFGNKTADEERYAQEAYGGYPFDLECWGVNGNRNGLPVLNNEEGTLSLSIKPENSFSYVQTSDFGRGLMAEPLYYIPKKGDTVQLRLRFEHCTPTSEKPMVTLHYIRDDMGDVLNEYSYGTLDAEAVLSGNYTVVEFPVSEVFANARCINSLRFTVSNVVDDGSGESQIIFDYFYVGSREHLPLQNKLFFGFDNSAEAQERYSMKTYGGHNFDTGCWGVNAIRANVPVLDNEDGSLSFTIPEGSNGPYFQTTTGVNSLGTMPLTYFPGVADLVQMRLKFQNCTGSKPDLRLYYIKDDSGTVTNDHSKVAIDASLLDADTYVVKTFAVPSGFTAAEVINSIRITLSDVADDGSGTGKVTIDYIYIGDKEGLPTPQYEVQFQDGDGKLLQSLTLHHGETAVYTGETPTKSPDEAYHYIFKGWDKALTNITADTTLTAQFTSEAHSLSYVSNGDGTHTAVCSRCDSTFTENHAFENGACFCGDKELTVDEDIKIYHTLDLASDISITFAVPVSALSRYDSYYLECILPEYEGNAQIGTSTVQIQPVVNGSYYYFTLTGITAVRLGDMVEAVLHMTKGTQAYISETDSYSVATYAYGMLNSTTNTKMLSLCADLLRYGAEAQSYKKYRTDALVDAAMTAAHRSYLSNTNALTFTATDSYLGDLENATITWVGKTLDLGSKVGMKFVFNAKSYGDVANLSMKVTYQGSNGETKTVTLTGAEAYNAANGYYSFTFYGLLASELRTVVDVAIYEGNTQLSETLRYSAESYASKTGGTALEPLTRALFAYSDSAKAYFTK